MYSYTLGSVDDLIFDEVYEDIALQDAYERGYKDAFKKTEEDIDSAYQAGYDDAEDEISDTKEEEVEHEREVIAAYLEGRLFVLDDLVQLFMDWASTKAGVKGTVYDILEDFKEKDPILHDIFKIILDEIENIKQSRRTIQDGNIG